MTRLAVLTAGLRRAEPPAPGGAVVTPCPPLDEAEASPPAFETGKRKHRRRAIEERSCAGCGRPLRPRARVDALYCGTVCRVRASRARKRDGGER